MVFGLKLGLSKKAPAEPPRAEPQAQSKTTSGSSGGGKGKSALTVNEFVARTKKCRERGLEPTKPELIAYARYLGIDPIIDADLMWIADESLNAPLPSEWTEHNDSADRVFYYNVQTHASSWTHPLEQLHRDTYKRIVAFRNGDMSKEDQAVQLEKWRQECEEAEQDAHKQLQAWTEHVDEQGKKFYYNRDQERSTWTDPRPARCHSLYLQMKALRVLSKHCGQSTGSLQRLEPIRLDLGPPSGHQARDTEAKRERSERRGDRDDRERDRSARSDDNRGAYPLSDDAEDDQEARKKKKKKEKKRREKEAEQSRDGGGGGGYSNSSQLAPLNNSNNRNNLPQFDAGGDFAPVRGAMQSDKPSAVEEVRASLGLGNHGGLPQLRPLRGGQLSDGARMPTPPGDSLTTVGRAKVRGGIRLEPLGGL
jgi:hypothetical protein